MIRIQKLKESDYEDFLVKWWEDWGWTPPPKDVLPFDMLGMCIYDDKDNIPICAGFLYLTNSKIGWVEWVVSNKNYRKKPWRVYAVRFLVDSLTEYANKCGCKYVYASLKNPSLINTYKLCGYNMGDTNMTEMIKVYNDGSSNSNSIGNDSGDDGSVVRTDA